MGKEHYLEEEIHQKWRKARHKAYKIIKNDKTKDIVQEDKPAREVSKSE